MARQPRHNDDVVAADIAAFVEALRPVRVGRDNYTRLDRYRDFKSTFGTDAGKRVLSQIIDLCEGPVMHEADVDNHARLAYRAGMRRIGLTTSAWASVPPREQEGEAK